VGYNGELRKKYYQGCTFSGNALGKYLKFRNTILIKESLREHITSLKHHWPNLGKPIKIRFTTLKCYWKIIGNLP
jgi:hypothetical protein